MLTSSIEFGIRGLAESKLAWVYPCPWWERLLVRLRIWHGGPLITVFAKTYTSAHAQCDKCRNWTDLFQEDIEPWWAFITGEAFRGRGLHDHDWHWNGRVYWYGEPRRPIDQ